MTSNHKETGDISPVEILDVSSPGFTDNQKDGKAEEEAPVASSSSSHCLPSFLSRDVQFSPKPKLYCANCFGCIENMKLCTRCKIVAYCGRDCQVLHWKRLHRGSCSALAELRAQQGSNTQAAAAHVIFQMAYRTSASTLEQCRYMYQVALVEYQKALQRKWREVVMEPCHTPQQPAAGLPASLQHPLDHYRLLLVTMGLLKEFVETFRPWDEDDKHYFDLMQDPATLQCQHPATQLSILIYQLQLLAKNSEMDDVDNDSSIPSAEILKERILQHLQDPDYTDLWKAFFYRGNDQGYGSPLLPWGAQVMGWDDEHDQNHLRATTHFHPPKDFYLWLQDCCFFDANISQVIDEVVEPCLDELHGNDEIQD
jgi:hypothetical protein